MSICVSVRVGEGLVLAADSTSTIEGAVGGGPPGVLKTYDHASKLCQLKDYPIGVASWGLGSVSTRAIASLVAEFSNDVRPAGEAPGYKAQDIANLYLRRWEMEVDLRHMKSVLQLDVFRGKSPDIVRKEFWTHLVVYNLVRSVMWEAAASHALSPSGLEFQRRPPAPQYLRAQHRRRPLFTLVPQTP